MKLVITAMIESVPRKAPENDLASVSNGVLSLCSASRSTGVQAESDNPAVEQQDIERPRP